MDRATRAKVAYALQKGGEPLAKRRVGEVSGAVVQEDGNSVIVSFYNTGRVYDPARQRQRMEKYRKLLLRRGFSVTRLPDDELTLRVL